MQGDCSNVASEQKGFDSRILRENHGSMEKSRSVFSGDATKLEGEPDALLEVSKFEEASWKKAALDEAFVKRLNFCYQYSFELLCGESCRRSKQKAETKSTNLYSRKYMFDQNYK